MIYLASSSPRRRELLEQAGISFTVAPADADERFADGTPPEAAVKLLARRKADAVFAHHPDGTILAADTVVALGETILGKPKTPARAVEMLRLLSGKTHEVFTGFCILSRERCVVESVRTEVTFYPLTEREIDAYVSTGEPMDKAGAYGIQGRGALLVQEIAGDYYNVVGLPVARVARLLAQN